MQFSDKTIIITGGSSGIGADMALNKFVVVRKLRQGFHSGMGHALNVLILLQRSEQLLVR